MKWMPRNWRDILAVPVLVLLPPLLIVCYANGVQLPEMVVGQFLSGWMLAAVFYYRKANTEAQ
jgi:hypothetical protein